MKINNIENLKEQIIDTLKQIFDPEIPVNIYDLGLIYEIQIDKDSNVNIVMTLTSPNCPVAEILPTDVKNKVAHLPWVNACNVSIVFEPQWTTDMMSDATKLDLGLL